MSDFEANHSLTELSSVPTESKEASVSDRKKLLLFPELLYFIIIIFFIKIWAFFVVCLFSNIKMPACYEFFEIMFSDLTAHFDTILTSSFVYCASFSLAHASWLKIQGKLSHNICVSHVLTCSLLLWAVQDFSVGFCSLDVFFSRDYKKNYSFEVPIKNQFLTIHILTPVLKGCTVLLEPSLWFKAYIIQSYCKLGKWIKQRD